MTAADVLRRARAVLVERGWYQGAYSPEDSDQSTCPVCAYGAINVATSGKPDDSVDAVGFAAEEALRAVVRDIARQGVVPWNDTPGRTLDEVLAAFDRAIAIAEAQS